MSAIITSTSANPYYVNDAETYVDNASNLVVYTGSTGQTGTGHVVDPVLEGSGMSAALKIVAAGINRDISWDSSFTLTNLRVTGNVYGGLIVSSNTNTALPVAASQVAQKYYVGSTPSTIRQAVLTGNTSVTIENGNYTNVFGGGAGYGSKVTGDTEINWKGNSVNNIYGGGDIGSVVEGDTNVNIIGNSTGNAYYGYYSYGGRISKVYGGGKNSIVKGDSNVTFSSDAALINFTGTVYGSGEGKNSIVKGSRNLVFDNYSNDFKATIVDFTNISFEGATSVTMTRAQNKSVIGATYEFDINDDSLKNIKAMLVWNMNNVRLNNVVVTIGTSTESVEPQMLDQGATIDLISSKYFVNDSSFNTSNVLVLNDEGNRISKFLYTLSYQKYDKKTKEGGLVSINYKGTANLMVDGSETEKVVLTGRNDEVNLTAGGNLVYGLETAGGDDTVNVQVGAVINGTISLGAGDDTLCIQVGATLNGCIDLGSGDDHMVLAAGAVVNCDVALGAGKNDVTVQNHAMITGTVRFADGSDNTIIINGGAISSFAGGDAETNNTLVVNGSRLYLPILGPVYSGGIGYFQNILPNSIDISGIVGTVPVDLGLTIDDENWILANMFVAQDLNLGASNDTVTFNSYAQVMNINLGAGDDKLTLNEEAMVRGDINLGSGDNVLVLNCGHVFNGRLIENLDSTVVIVAGTNMELDGDKLGLGSTNNVLVVTKGAQVEVEGGSMGRFLEGDDVYLCQNAIISYGDFECNTDYIQNYTGYLTVDGDLVVWAEPDMQDIPEQVLPYYKITTPGGVVNAEIETEGDFVVTEGAHVTDSLVDVEENFFVDVAADVNASEVRVGGDAIIDGTFIGGILDVEGMIVTQQIGASGTNNIFEEILEGGNLYVDGGITGATIYVDGDAYIDGTITNSFIKVDDVMLRTYTEDEYHNIDVTDVDRVGGNAVITGVVTGSTLTAEEVVFDAEGAIFTGSIFAHEVEFNYDFISENLVISTHEIELEEGISVTIASTDADEFEIERNSKLIELVGTKITVGLWTEDVSFLDGYNVSIRGEIRLDMYLTNNTVSLDEGEHGEYGYFTGKAFLSGANILVVNDDDWYDWQQFVFAPEATLGFEIADFTFFAIDGYIGDQQTIQTLVIDTTTLGQNSELGIGSWIYIKDWRDMEWSRPYTLPVVNPFLGDTDGVPSLNFENLYVMAGAEIWGGIKLDDHDNELVINDGAVINGGTHYYDYATIQTLGGNDTVTIGAATINGQIDTGTTMEQGFSGASEDDDSLMLDGTILNAAVNQGVPVITMGWGNDDLSILGGSVVTGDISLGDGHDDALISASTVNGTIDLGEGYNDLAVISSTVGIVADSISDDAIVGGSAGDDVLISASTVNGDIELGDGNNELAIVAGSTLNGNIELGSDDDEVEIEASIVNGSIDLGEGDNELDIVASTVGIEVTVDAFGHRGSDDAIIGGSDNDDVYISASTVNGDIELGDGNNDLDVRAASTVNGDIKLGDNYDSVTIKDSTVNGSIDLGGATGVDDLGYGHYEYENELAVINSTVGIEVLPADYGHRVSDDAIVAGDEADDIYISGSTVNGDIELGDGYNDLDIKAASVVNGDIELGDDENTLDIDASIVNGDIELGHGDNDIWLTDSTVNGTIVSHNDAMLAVDNSTVNGDVVLFSNEDNDLFVTNAFTINSISEPLIAEREEITISGLIMMANENNISLDEVASITVGAVEAGFIIDLESSITMLGESNNINTHEYRDEYELGSGETFAVGDISNQITANALNMIAVDSGYTAGDEISNNIRFGVEGEVDGEYATDPYGIQPGLHKISSLEIGSVGMTLTAPVTMVAEGLTGSNWVDMDYELYAENEGDIVVTGNANISMIGGITMVGFDNDLSANIDFVAENQGKVNVGDNSVALLIDGDIKMYGNEADVLVMNGQGLSGSNDISLGYRIDDNEVIGQLDEPGEVIANGSYTVTVDGSIVMGGIGVTNTMTIDKNVTINGSIIMGLVNGGPANDTNLTGDDLAFSNVLTVNDPGSFNIDGTIVLTARSNTVVFNGVGDVTGLVSIYGGSNSLYVAEDVTINDIVSFGGVYDADHIGVEGYLIQANTENEIDIYGTVKGIDTSIDLAGPTGVVNASNDDIDIYGTVTEGITTGNGNDDVDIHGGSVGGNIVMGDRASGATGWNDLYIEAEIPEEPTVSATLLGGAATVAGDVIMETTTTNRLAMEGAVVTDFSDMLIPETVYRATINGNVLMNAIEGVTGGTGGTNTVLLGDGFHESATTIVGNVTMNAGTSNSITVDTGWLYEFDMDGSHDAASYVNSFIAMATEGDNTLNVDHGTFIIGATAGDGLSMRQDLFKQGITGGNNLISVEEEARLVMTSDVRMGNTVDEILVYGAYDYLYVTITGNIETYHFVWNGDVTGTLFDTVENKIDVDGKMFAANIVMTGSDNDIFLTGPAEVPWTVDAAATVLDAHGPTGATAAIMDVDNITMNGWTNTIRVEGITYGDALFNSGNILMRWGGTTLGAPIDATTNIITNDDDGETLFNSGSIQMYASNANTLRIYGLENADGTTNTQSTITGGVTMMTTAIAGVTTDSGINYAEFEDVSVTGNVFMQAGGGVTGHNELYLIGGTGAGGTYSESNISGNLTMITDIDATGVTTADDVTGMGDNYALITVGNVGGNVSMTASGATGDNTLTVLGGITGGVTYTADIGGGIVMDSNAGNNVAFLMTATVGAGITMDAGEANWAKLSGSMVSGPVSQTAGTWNYLGIDPSTVTGNVTMTSVLGGDIIGVGSSMTGGNFLDVDGATAGSTLTSIDVFQSGIGGNVVMDANLAGSTAAYGYNYADINMAGITGSLSMTSVYGINGGNHLDLDGGIGSIGVTGTIVESNIGGLNMTSSGVTAGATAGDNIAHINISNVNGNVVMTASGIGADNDLEVVGGINEFGVTYTSDITGGILMDSSAGYNIMGMTMATVGGISPVGITMDAATSNTATINDSTVTGNIVQIAGTWNTLLIDPSTVNGNVSMTAVGGNVFTLLGESVGATLTESFVNGNVSLIASGDTGTNVVTIVGGDVTGSIDMSTTGLTYGSNVLTAVGVTGDKSDIGGGIDMSIAGSYLGNTNVLTLVKTTVGAGITMSTLGGNVATIVDSGITGDINQSAGASNSLSIDPSTINGNIGMTAGISNVFEIGESTVNGNVTMFATAGGNTFEFGGISPEGPGLGATQSFVNGDVTMTAGATGGTGADNAMFQFGDVSGSISMGATAGGDNALWITGDLTGGVTLTSDVTGGVNMTTFGGTGSNWLLLQDYSSIGGGVTMMSGASGSSLISVDSTSSITGNIVTGDGNDYLDIHGVVTGGISTGLGNDDLDVFAGATVSGAINMGLGNNDIDLGYDGPGGAYLAGGTTYMFSDIGADAGGIVDISGSGSSGTNEILLITDSFGTSGSTMTVEGSVDTLMFNTLGTDVHGVLDTENGAGGVTGTINVFDVSGSTSGILIDANNSTSWDIMETGGLTGAVEIFANDGMTGGNSVTLVENYTGLDLDSWSHNAVTLNIVGDSSLTLTWNGSAYVGTDSEGDGTRTWTLDDADSKASLKLSVAFTPVP